ncbi:MAG: cyclase family protein [Planctomycetota bacterium]|nr:MAG: cyclase family protein [Planctomycetota bacterium]
MARLIELSRVIEPGMITDPRLPAPAVRDVWTRRASAAHYAPGVSFQIAAIDLPQNTGTYLDAPFHRHDGAPGVWDTPIERVAHLPGVRVDVRGLGRGGRRAIEPADFAQADIRGAAVLFWTGFDALWDEPAYRANEHPFISSEAARTLVERGAALAGLDAINADDTADGARPAHTILLGAGVCIVENLVNLGALPERGFRFTAAPVRAKGLGSFPVRAFAVAE